MPLLSFLLALALGVQLALPAFAAAAAPPATAGAHATTTAATRSPRQRGDGGLAHIRIGCAVLPHRAPRPIVVIIPTVTVLVISVCWNPQDLFRARRA